MGRQLTLDDQAKKLARREHPVTSKIAAAEIVPKLGERQREALDMVAAHPGYTQAELDAVHQGADRRAIGRRMNELERALRVRRGDKRICTITGKLAFTWWALP